MIRVLLAALLCVAAEAADIDKLWDFDLPAESEQRFRTALVAAQREADVALQAELVTQIARARGLQGDMAAANAALDSLVPRLAELPPAVSVRYMLERGRLYQLATDIPKAKRWLRNALSHAQRHQLDYLAIDALQMLGYLETAKNAVGLQMQALNLALASQDPRAQNWLGVLYQNLGWTYRNQRDYPKALDFFRQAQAWHEQRGGGKPWLIARWSVAKVLRESGEPDKALLIQLDVERGWQKLGQTDGHVLEEIGENLLTLGRRAEARPYFVRALDVLSRDPWFARNEPARHARLAKLAQ
ncbi:tetratricopeptide repeat protein [Chitinimonas sp. BJYL2]|uniref:tetratricopeptide repeat protein n=1 Tax=Chitinimonas sp. BJYL2 TaxID=2976696 RepID=UPI0022B4797F|nr:tetratricopeptide repeat protein [Chitinimonas sp. BJYL2]